MVLNMIIHLSMEFKKLFCSKIDLQWGGEYVFMKCTLSIYICIIYIYDLYTYTSVNKLILNRSIFLSNLICPFC